MKVMVVGGGAREHALAWRLAKSPSVQKVFACPGNPGIAGVATCLPKPADIAGYADIAASQAIDLTVVGPEAPLVDGIVDLFRARGLQIIGPTQAAARLEGSKIFAKQFFQRAGIPTATFRETSTMAEAREAIRQFALPLVVKADGLAAGKGVIVAQTWDEAEKAIESLGPRLVVEEFLEGEEVSFIGISDGETLLPFAPTQDHKRLLDGDLGPNTGGMGAYCDSRILTSSQTGDIMDRVMLPAIARMGKEGMPFTGFLYAGLMMTATGPKLLEFNVRLGDPETQCLMYSYEGDLMDLFSAATTGISSAPGNSWRKPSVCVVMAGKGYPGEPVTGNRIEGISQAEATGVTVFQAATRLVDGALLSDGGRVLSVTAGGETLEGAIENAYSAVATIRFPESQYRTDIGRRGLKRW